MTPPGKLNEFNHAEEPARLFPDALSGLRAGRWEKYD